MEEIVGQEEPAPVGKKEITGDRLSETLPAGALVSLESCGNPDKGQDPDKPIPGVPTLTYPVTSLKFAAAACRTYILNHQLGGGDWAGGDVLVDGKKIAYVSYNGRVWEPKE